MATRSLRITSKHFFRLKLRKCIPDPIDLQYSVNCSEDIEKKAESLTYSFSLLYDNNKTPGLSYSRQILTLLTRRSYPRYQHAVPLQKQSVLDPESLQLILPTDY